MQRPRHLFLARATMTLLLALFTSIGAWATITGSGDKYDPYVLNTAEDWTTFAGWINNSSKSNSTYFNKYFKLSDSWDNSSSPVTVAVGTKSNPFVGVFDGNGKTLYVNISDTENQGTAPFRTIARNEYSNSCEIKNLTVTGNVTGATYAAGLVGFCNGSIYNCCSINNCKVDVNVSVPASSGDCTMGGVIGYINSSGVNLQNVIFSGTMDNKTGYAGGLAGWSTNTCCLKINNYLFKGSYTGSASNGFHPMAIRHSNFDFYQSDFKNCYYTADPTLTDEKSIVNPGTRVYASADVIPGSVLNKNLYAQITATDNVRYYAPVTFTGINTFYKYTGSAITIDERFHCFRGKGNG